MANKELDRYLTDNPIGKTKPAHRLIEELLAKAVVRGMNDGKAVADNSQNSEKGGLQLGEMTKQSVHTDPSQIEGVFV
jgi:hypothetical protein